MNVTLSNETLIKHYIESLINDHITIITIKTLSCFSSERPMSEAFGIPGITAGTNKITDD